MTHRRAIWSLILVSAGLRVVWAGLLGPGNDEAYHYLLAERLDLSYFDHPPLMAWLQRPVLAFLGDSASIQGLRLVFIAMFAGSTWVLASLTARFAGERAGLLAALCLNLDAYHSLAAGTFVLPDGPLLLFWLLTLDRLFRAMEEPDRLGPWLVAGVCWGGAMLSKYHAVFLPAGFLANLLLNKEDRSILKRPGPYLAAAIGILLFAPVLVWNARHDWVSFRFQGARALGEGGFKPESLLGAIVGQACYLFPWVWIALISVLFTGLRRIREGTASRFERLCVRQSVIPLILFLGVACFKPVLPHWTLVGYVSLFPLLGAKWAELEATAARSYRLRLRLWAGALIVGAAGFLIQYETGLLQKGGRLGLGLIDPIVDPTVDLQGWDQLAAELDRRGLVNRPNTFLFTGSWYLSGQLAYALRGRDVPVLCYHPYDARGFAFWSKPGDWLGRDGILVSVNRKSAEPGCYERWFADREPIDEFSITRAGGEIRNVRLFQFRRQIASFPYDYSGPSRAGRRLNRPVLAEIPREETSR